MDKTTAGWNDPPMMTSQVPDATKPRTLLNKRVAYPLTSSSTNEIPKHNHGAMLPPTTCQIPRRANVTEAPNKQESFTKISENINKVTEEIENDSKKQEILKRLDVMKNMWQEDNLNAEIHNKVANFFESLQNNDIDAANEIYMSLTINSAALCSPWIIALKYIIHHYKSKG